MYRYFHSFFVCILALAACSPRIFQGEHAAGAAYAQNTSDSVSVQRMIDRSVHEIILEQLHVQELRDGVFVREFYSAPDSAGQQYVMFCETATTSTQKTTSLHKAESIDTAELVKTDSVATEKEMISSITEERENVNAKADGAIPWYVYIGALVVAVLVGFALGAWKGNWILKR